jgi:NAD(P)H-hydrate repair Nnr-like enzyme with NAD(P)H-hydrate dehydratase domain
LFTTQSRDQAGRVWFDDLQCALPADLAAAAWLAGRDAQAATAAPRPHASHKGSVADVVVIGGQDTSLNGAGMTGATILAARAALRGGAGRVLVGLLADDSIAVCWDHQAPELMFQRIGLLLERDALSRSVVVCGCGGADAVTSVLTAVIARAWRLVLDADARMRSHAMRRCKPSCAIAASAAHSPRLRPNPWRRRACLAATQPR